MEIRKENTIDIDFLRIVSLYIKLLWNHIVFWTFPTPPKITRRQSEEYISASELSEGNFCIRKVRKGR